MTANLTDFVVNYKLTVAAADLHLSHHCYAAGLAVIRYVVLCYIDCN